MPAVKPSSPSIEVEPLSLSPRGAAAFTGYSKRTIYRMLNAGVITARRDGTKTLIDVASIRSHWASLGAYVPGVSVVNAPHVTNGRRKMRRTRPRG